MKPRLPKAERLGRILDRMNRTYRARVNAGRPVAYLLRRVGPLSTAWIELVHGPRPASTQQTTR